MRVNWLLVLDEARRIIAGYERRITLRQLFYRLVAKGVLENTRGYYQRLSKYTAAARRERENPFPALIDRTRSIRRAMSWDSTEDAMDCIARNYRRDRTEGQPVALYLGVEKDADADLLYEWFGEPLGIPIVALGGFDSQSHLDEVIADAREQAKTRPVVMLYAGDYDCSGKKIAEDFRDRGDWPGEFIELVLTPDQIDRYVRPSGLPVLANPKQDPRRKWFIAKYGAENLRRWGIENPQVEMDALEPDVLYAIFEDAINRYFNQDAYDAVMKAEAEERGRLTRLAEAWRRRDELDDDDEN
jgi:hypothetical protein